DTDLRVCGLAVVHVPDTTTEAEHGVRHRRLAEAPAGLVHLVNALVAEVAVAVVPDPVPVVVDRAVLAVRVVASRHLERGRAGPQVVVHRRRRLLLAHLQPDVADARAVSVAHADRQIDLPEFAALHVSDGLTHAGVAAALRADLTDALGRAGDSGHDRAFADVVRRRLLDVHVLVV